jgi:hypothetical protein
MITLVRLQSQLLLGDELVFPQFSHWTTVSIASRSCKADGVPSDANTASAGAVESIQLALIY